MRSEEFHPLCLHHMLHIVINALFYLFGSLESLFVCVLSDRETHVRGRDIPVEELGEFLFSEEGFPMVRVLDVEGDLERVSFDLDVDEHVRCGDKAPDLVQRADMLACLLVEVITVSCPWVP